MKQTYSPLPRLLSSCESFINRLVPIPAIDGVITIRCDDVFDTLLPSYSCDNLASYDAAMGIDRFLNVIANHPAEHIEYQLITETCQKLIEEAKSSPFIMPLSDDRDPITLTSQRTIGNRGYFSRVLILMKSMIQSLKTHYDKLENEGVAIWNGFGLTMNEPNLIPYVNQYEYHDFVAWRCLPLFQAALMISRYHLLCRGDVGMYYHLYLGQISIMGIVNRLMDELNFPHREVIKAVLPKNLYSFFKKSTPNTRNATYFVLVGIVEEMAQRNEFLTMKMIHHFLPISPDCQFHKLSNDLFAHVGSYLIGECKLVKELVNLR